jgi:hypothetical protein
MREPSFDIDEARFLVYALLIRSTSVPLEVRQKSQGTR